MLGAGEGRVQELSGWVGGGDNNERGFLPEQCNHDLLVQSSLLDWITIDLCLLHSLLPLLKAPHNLKLVSGLRLPGRA